MFTKSAYEYGQDAFLNGSVCSPTLDHDFIVSIGDDSAINQRLEAWTDGWIQAQREVTNTSWVGAIA